jgi:hypothetical protein
MQSNNEIAKLELENRKKLVMSKVEAVNGFTSQSLKLTVAGEGVEIYGEDIKISSFNKTTGALMCDGKFNGIKYCGEKIPFIKKIFK